MLTIVSIFVLKCNNFLKIICLVNLAIYLGLKYSRVRGKNVWGSYPGFEAHFCTVSSSSPSHKSAKVASKSSNW